LDPENPALFIGGVVDVHPITRPPRVRHAVRKDELAVADDFYRDTEQKLSAPAQAEVLCQLPAQSDTPPEFSVDLPGGGP